MIKKITILNILILTNFQVYTAGDIDKKKWFTAAVTGNLELIKNLIDKVKINTQDAIHRTALIWAAFKGHENMVKFLLTIPKINLEVRDSMGYTALMWAVYKSNENIVKLLLDAGAEPYTKFPKGETILSLASTEFKPILEKMLNKSKQAYLQQWFEAVKKGDLQMLKEVVEKIDINAQDETGQTALMRAASNGYENIVKYLLKFPDIEVNIQNSIGESALYFASIRGRENIVKMLLQDPKTNINILDTLGNNALMAAVIGRYEGIVRLLLQVGIDPDIKNKAGQKAIDRASPTFRPTVQALINAINLNEWIGAAENGQVETIRKLIGKININAADTHGYTALILATRFEHGDLVKFLLESPNIDVNAQTTAGDTALMFAVNNGNETIVKLLLKVPAINVNLRSNNGGTALLIAAAQSYSNIAKLLLQVPNIDLNVRNKKQGTTALMYAAYSKNETLAKMLLAAGADPNIKNNEGLTALAMASPTFRPILEELINEALKRKRAISSLSADLYSLSKA